MGTAGGKKAILMYAGKDATQEFEMLVSFFFFALFSCESGAVARVSRWGRRVDRRLGRIESAERGGGTSGWAAWYGKQRLRGVGSVERGGDTSGWAG